MIRYFFILTIASFFITKTYGSKKDSLENKLSNDSLSFGSIAWVFDQHNVKKEFKVIDTTLKNFHISNPAFRKDPLLISLGNLGAPVYSMVYENRKYSDYYFVDSYTNYFTFSDEQVYYNTKKPFTNIWYSAGPEKEQIVDFTHTQNVFKDLNLGLNLRYFSALGQYGSQAQSSKGANVNVWTSYVSSKYKMHASYYYGRNKIDEYGGLQNDSAIYNDIGFLANLTKAYSWTQYQNLEFHQEWNLARPRLMLDTTSIEYPPFKLALRYTLNAIRADRFFTDTDPTEDYYLMILDTISETTKERIWGSDLINKVGLVQNMKSTVISSTVFADLGIETENHYFRDFVGLYPEYDFVNKFAQAGIYLELKENLLLKGDYKQYFDGRKKYDQLLNVSLHSEVPLWGSNVKINLRYSGENKTPGFLYSTLLSNHYYWSNSLKEQKENKFKGNISFFSDKVTLFAAYSVVNNFLFLAADKQPRQSDQVSIQTFGANIALYLWKFHIETESFFQNSSKITVIDLPQYVGKTSIYYKDHFFKERLTLKVGADLTYFTKYYASQYDVASGAFFNQYEKEIGDYPFVDAFLDIKYKRLRASLKYTQLTALFSGNKDYFTVLHYPQNPSSFYFAAAWHFYN